MSFTPRSIVGIVACVLVVAGPAWAADPQLRQIVPQGAQRGTEVALEFVGPRLGKEPQQLLLDRPGIEVLGLERVDDNRCRAQVRVAPDAPLGIHPVRVRTASGLSNLMTLHLGALPEIDEQEPNSAFESPQPIPLGTTVRGVIQNEDVDYFAVDVAAGERLSVEIEGLRLGRTFFDPALAILDARRFELAASDDASLTYQDACASIVVEEAGTYVIAVRESAYQGNDQCSYRLHVGRFPRPTIVYPPGGPPGAALEVRWLGDPRGEIVQTVTLPDAEADEHFLFYEDEHGVTPTGVPVRVRNLPNSLEIEPNDRRDAATAAVVPGALCGVISQPGDRDAFRFSAKKDQVLDIRVHARRLRSPLDAVLRVLDAKGKRLAGNDDEQSYPDSYVQFRVPEDGDYVVEVEDHLRQGGPEFVYRVELAPPPPVADIRLDEQRRYVSQTVEVPRGNRSAVLAIVSRRNFGGELALAWDDLPPGMTAELQPLAADYNVVPVLFRAADDAPLGAALARVTARAPEGAEGVADFLSRFEQQTWLVRGSNNVAVWSHMAQRAPVAVTQAVPFRIAVDPPRSPLVQNGSKNLRVTAERAEGFDGPIAVRLLYNPPGLSSNASLSIPQGATEASIPVTAAGNAMLRAWNLLVVGEANVDGRVVVASEFFALQAAAPYVTATFPSVATEPGRDVEYPVDLAVQTQFAGEARLELTGLPPGVSCEPQQITAATERATFPLRVTADAKPGVYKQLFCRLTVMENEEPVEHTLATGELRIDQPPPPPQASAPSAEEKAS